MSAYRPPESCRQPRVQLKTMWPGLRIVIGLLTLVALLVIGWRSLNPFSTPAESPPPTSEASLASEPSAAEGNLDEAGIPIEVRDSLAETAQAGLALLATIEQFTGQASVTQQVTQPAMDSRTTTHQTVVSRELVATDLLSMNEAGAPVDRPVTGVALAADGQIAAFASRAGNLDTQNFAAEMDAARRVEPRGAVQNGIPNNAHSYEQIYVIDLTTQRLELITLGVDGMPGNGWSSAPALSPDGRFVAFYSWAGNLVPDDTNAVQDAFVYDRQTQTMARVSISSAGRQGNDRSGDSRAGVRPALSADGRFVAFHSDATNLVETPVAGTQVYLHDRETGTTSLVSAAGVEDEKVAGDGDSIQPALSADGRFVAFQSRAQNFMPQPSAPEHRLEHRPEHLAETWQIWLLDRATGEMTLVSQGQDPQAENGADTQATQGGAWGNGDSTWPSLAGDGQRIAFQTTATNLMTRNPRTLHAQHVQEIMVFDRPGGEMWRASVSSMGLPGNRDASLPALALDGRYVAFVSAASNLVNDDANDVADVFIHDLQTRHTSRVSVRVTGVWTGIEADAPVTGPPAPSADGRLVAFVSQAANLLPASTAATVAEDGPVAAQAYVHERRAPETHRLDGRILDPQGQPIAQAVIRAGPHRAESGIDGRYHFPALVGGTYALTAEHDRFSFSPPRRVTSVLRATQHVDFIGFAGIDPAHAFLDLPLAYDGSPATFLQALRDTSEGGLVDAWFDHAYPDYSKTGSILLWDGRLRDVAHYNDELGCYQRRCYDGHDGIDFPYRAKLVDRSIGPLAIPIFAAAPGRVVHVIDDCRQADRWCNGGYGNEVILYHNLDHDNGYFTRYSHLDRVDVAPQTLVARETQLGLMGSTGNSHGIHLHFGVHRDNGNARWDGGEVDLPVDPFGWAGTQPDPWVADRGGPVSHWLWLHHPTTDAALVGSMGGVVRDVAGHVRVEVPGGAFQGQARFELAPAAPEGAMPADVRSVGRGFWLRILDWLAGPQEPGGNPLNPDQPLTIHISLEDLDLRHLALEQLTIYRWTSTAHARVPLPTTVNKEDMTVSAKTDRLGNFDLQGPLLCPQDGWEPDDSYFAAVPLDAGGAPMRRLFDVPTDEDWFRIAMTPDRAYTATVEGFGPGVLPELTLFDADGVTELAQIAAESDTSRLTLNWSDPDPGGDFYLRLQPLATSATGCDAVYSLRVE